MKTLFCLSLCVLYSGPVRAQPKQSVKTDPSDMLIEKKDATPGEQRIFEVGNGLKITFCWIPASKGKLTLGCPKKEEEYFAKKFNLGTEFNAGAGNQFEIDGLDGFWMAKTEMTQAQYAKIVGKNPSHFSKQGKGKWEVHTIANTDDFPVEQVSWNDAETCIAKMQLSPEMKGWKIRLPSKAQWEYAYRGGLGVGRAYYWGNELKGDKANCNGAFPFGAVGEDLGRTAKVGSYETKAIHPWGLVDMSGNVWEWCEDYYYPTYEELPKTKNPVQSQKKVEGALRVIRGGGWFTWPPPVSSGLSGFF